MADLGNLYFDLLLRDRTVEDAKKIKAQLEKDLKAKLNIDFDKKQLVSDVRATLQSEKYKIDVVVDKANTTQAVRAAMQAAGLNPNYSAGDLRAAKAAALQAKAEAEIGAQRELVRQRAARATKAELDLANARERSSNAARSHATATLSMNGAMSSQLSIAGQLKNEFLGLYSIYALQNALRSIVDIGGELENQKIAMSSILQDAGKATTVFNQIKSLAVQSPFGVMDLNQYAKQLSAYSVPYNELYDTIKRLADISAGVGVDMGRIILAYGQIKAAKFLKGTELRQLTEANIPMVDKLSERFSKLEGRIISTGEVMDMISKKKVTFEDVKDVLWDMTGDGGMFNNMQEVLSESVKSKWKNLGDAIDIMMGDIAESMGSSLKWTAETLTTLTQNWQELVPVIQSAIAAFGVYKVAVFAANRVVGAGNATLIKSILLSKQQTAANLVVASSYRTLTDAEKGIIASSRNMATADWKALAASGALTKEHALRLMAIGKLKSGQAGHIAQVLGISRAEMGAALSTSRWKAATISLGYGIKQLGVALKGMLINPYMLLFAGLSAGAELYYKSTQKAEERQERISEIAQKAGDGFKNLSKEAQKFADIDPFKVNDASLITSIEEMKNALKDYSPTWADTFNQVFATDEEGKNVNSLAEQYIKIRDALNETKEGYKLLNEIKGTAEYANESTDGWSNESFSENIEDYIKAEQNADKIVGKMTGSYIEYSTAMQEAITKNKDFAEVASGKSLKEQLNIIKDYPKAIASLGGALPFTGGFRDDLFGLRMAWENSKRVFEEEVAPDMGDFIQEYKSRLQAAGWNINSLTESQKIAIGLDINAFMDNFKNMPTYIRRFLNGEILEKEFKIKVDAEFEDRVQALSDLQQKLNEVTNGKYEAQIKVSTDSDKIVESIRKEYKEAKETVDNLKPILIKAGIDVTGIKVLDLDKLGGWQKQIATDYLKAYDIKTGGEKGAKEMGFSLTDPSKNKKDAFAEQMKERVNLLKDAYSEYKKWSDLVGKEEATAKVKGSGIFDYLFKGKESVDIDNYKEELNKLLNQLDNKTKERRELKVSIRKVLLDIDANAVKEASEKALSEVEQYIQDTTKKWDVYKNAFEGTSNKKLAMQLAFGGNVSSDNIVDDLQAKIQETMQENNRVNVDFSTLVGMNTKDIEQKFGKPLANLVKSYQEETGKLKEETVKNFLDILKHSADFGEQIAAIDAKLQRDIADLESNRGNLSDSDYKRRRKFLKDESDKDKSSVRFKEFKQTSDWVKVFDDLDRVSTSTLNEMIGKISEFAQQAGLSEEVIKQLVEAMRKLREESIDRNPFQGLSNAVNNHSKWSFAKDRLGNNDSFTFKRDEGGFKKGQAITKKDVDNGLAESNDDMEKSALAIVKKFQAVADAADMLGGMFENLGVNMDGFLGGITDIIGGAASGAQAGAGIASVFGAAGPWGAAAGAAIGMLSAVFALHDKKQEKIINESKQRVQELQNLYDGIERSLNRFLGSGTELKLVDAEKDKESLSQLNREIESIRRKGTLDLIDISKLSSYSKESEKLQKRVSAYNQGGAYGYQRALMQEQVKELESQRRAEIDKKKTDDGKVADYENQIAEMKQQVLDFAEETTESLYGINLKDWASQLGDALYEAWQKGEDGAESFKNKVADIMGNVMNSILKVGILEPAMKQLQTMLFGDDGMSGYFGKDFSLDEKEMEDIADYLMGVNEKTDDYYSALDKLNEYMEKKYGVSMKEEEEGSGLSKTVAGVTEDTANILASYINAIRADVSKKLEYVRRMVEDLFPAYNVIAQAQLQQLTMIQNNTAKNAGLVEEIRDIMNSNINGNNRFNI